MMMETLQTKQNKTNKKMTQKINKINVKINAIYFFIAIKSVSGSTYIPAKKGRVGYLFIYMPDKGVICSIGILTNRKAEPSMRARSLAVSLTSLK